MEPYGFKALVPVEQWVPQLPAITKFIPGHDHRIMAKTGEPNATTVDVTLEFNVPMDCDGVTQSISLNMTSSGKGGQPTITNVKCGAVSNPDPAKIVGADVSVWSWSATLTNFLDGVLTLTVDRAPSQGGNATTNVSCTLDSL